MNENEFGLSYNIEGVGYIDTRHDNRTLHDVKSIAGKAFHAPVVNSVCVYDNQGLARLYLKRTENGIVREEM